MISRSIHTVAFASAILLSSLVGSDCHGQQAVITHSANGPVIQPATTVPQQTMPSRVFNQPMGMPQQFPQQVPQQFPQQFPQQVPQQFPQQVPQQFPQQLPPRTMPQPQGGTYNASGVVPMQNGLVFDRMRGGWVTPNSFNGVNQQTGGINTYNEQVMDSTFQYGREQSKYNGSKSWVRRPVYGPNGTITGYQQGYTWRNSYTGQEHFDMKSYTPNNSGGVHEQRHTIQGKTNPNKPMTRPKT